MQVSVGLIAGAALRRLSQCLRVSSSHSCKSKEGTQRCCQGELCIHHGVPEVTMGPWSKSE